MRERKENIQLFLKNTLIDTDKQIFLYSSIHGDIRYSDYWIFLYIIKKISIVSRRKRRRCYV